MSGNFGNTDFPDEIIAAWRTQASCRGMSDLFFPVFNESTPAFDLREARCKAVCAVCPVRRECLDWALKDRDEGIDLVLGGFSYHERLVMMNRKNRHGRGK